MGRDLFRYEARVKSREGDDTESTLTMYLLNTQSGQGRVNEAGVLNP